MGLLIVALLAVPTMGWADDGRFHNERLILRVGALFADYDSRLKLDGDASMLIGTDLDLEQDLGLDDSDTLFTAELVLRITRNQRFEFSYVSLNREGSKVLTSTIQFGDETFSGSTNVSTKLNLDLYRFSYGYSFVNTGTTEIGFTVGVHVLDIDASISETFGLLSEQADVIAPLPNVGLYVGRVLTKSLAVVGKAQIFLLEVDEFDGQLINATVALEYLPFRRVSGGHVLIGGGYSLFDLDFDATSDDFTGGIDLEVSGPIAYVGVRF